MEIARSEAEGGLHGRREASLIFANNISPKNYPDEEINNEQISFNFMETFFHHINTSVNHL